MIVCLFPFGSLEVLVLISNIIELISDAWDGLVVNVDSGIVFIDVFLKSLTEVFPLFNESLSFWRCQEFLVESFNGFHLFSLTPSFEGAFEVSDRS